MTPDSLKTLLDKFAPIDDELPPEDFDPAALIGDIKDKVDAIKWKIDDWEYKAKMLEEAWIKPLQQKIRSLKGKADGLKDYMKAQMIEHSFEKLPGQAFRAQLQNSKASVVVDKEPLFQDFQAYPAYVRQDVSYTWNKVAIKDDLDLGKEINFARLKPNKTLRFYSQGDKE